MPLINRRTPTTIVEALNPHLGFCYTVKKTLYRGKTKFQKIELVDTEEFGTTLLLDGITQVVEKNHYQYHESMVHPALLAHPCPKDVLVVGGGDGGILSEVAKHPTVEKMYLAELDQEVVDFSKHYLPAVHCGCFDDSRLEVHIVDGRKFVETRPKQFDVVIMDMTDPFGPSQMLYTKEFYRAVQRSFKDDRGVFVMHSESPVTRPVAFNCIRTTLDSVFKHSAALYPYIQMYATLWSVSVCSNGIDLNALKPAVIDRRLRQRGINNLKLITGESVAAMQVTFPYVNEVLAKKTRVITDKQPDFPDNFINARA